MYETIINKTLKTRIIAIVRGISESSVLPLAKALSGGGIEMMEITFDQSSPESFMSTARSIELLRDRMSGIIFPGAGTVMTTAQVELAAKAGAQYIISPNVDTGVIEKTRELGLVSMPGAMTPSEAGAAHAAGADFVKIFPAGSLGPQYLKNICAPLSHIRFLAVGGIDENNAAGFIKAGAAGLGIGGQLINKDWIAAGDFDRITDLALRIKRAASVKS